jgi:hypothetical protein
MGLDAGRRAPDEVAGVFADVFEQQVLGGLVVIGEGQGENAVVLVRMKRAA